MNAGDIIECRDLEELLERHEALMREGWDVEFDFAKDGTARLLLKGRLDA